MTSRSLWDFDARIAAVLTTITQVGNANQQSRY
jgi:hypothetical protein